MVFEGPVNDVSSDCEQILRSLPRWFGLEASLLEYVRETSTLPTFVARDAGAVTAFLTLREHFPEAWEVNCIAVSASHRNRGIGRALHRHVEDWLVARGVRLLQVKTMPESFPSPEYAETRAFYTGIGYLQLEVFPELWGPRRSALQLVKLLPPAKANL
jgi:GNAT superfamily N-acetyltransferase